MTMNDTQMYALLHELERRRSGGAWETTRQRRDRHRGLQRSAREISLEVRRQRRHGEAA
jgi:hypothetical protein